MCSAELWDLREMYIVPAIQLFWEAVEMSGLRNSAAGTETVKAIDIESSLFFLSLMEDVVAKRNKAHHGSNKLITHISLSLSGPSAKWNLSFQGNSTSARMLSAVLRPEVVRFYPDVCKSVLASDGLCWLVMVCAVEGGSFLNQILVHVRSPGGKCWFPAVMVTTVWL